jgi:hypothetical protein
LEYESSPFAERDDLFHACLQRITPKNNGLEKVNSFAPESQSLDTAAGIMKKWLYDYTRI